MTNTRSAMLPKPFWVLWGVEFWERFGYYGMQAIIALYFVKELGFDQKHSIYLFGAFAAFIYGFVWLGGIIGDKYLGAKRSLVIGAVILMISYTGLALADKATIFYALAGIVIGNALFKANPSSLISKLFKQGDTALDSAMTMYYMAVNIGGFFSTILTPIVAQQIGWRWAFLLCGFGLFCGICNFFIFYRLIAPVATEAGKKPLQLSRLAVVLVGAVLGVLLIAKLLQHVQLCYYIVYFVVAGGFLYFIKLALSLPGPERTRMLVAFVLILEGIVFYTLYFQIPTSLTFLALHNVNNVIFGFNIPPAEYQALNPLIIFCASPILAWMYTKIPMTHPDKFCIGMTLCSIAFLILYLPQFVATNGIISPWWMVATYFFQSIGELFISALGLAMVAELCPRSMSGFVMGIWFLTTMLAGTIAGWVGGLTAPPANVHFTAVESLQVYGRVFAEVGIVTGIIAIVMWVKRPFFNRLVTTSHQLPGETLVEQRTKLK